MALAEGVQLKSPQLQAKMDMDQLIAALAQDPRGSQEA